LLLVELDQLFGTQMAIAFTVPLATVTVQPLGLVSAPAGADSVTAPVAAV